MKDYKNEVAKSFTGILPNLSVEKIEQLIERPKSSNLGDFAVPMFSMAKEMRKSPVEIAKEIAPQIHSDYFASVQATGPYVNVFMNKQLMGADIINEIVKDDTSYGDADLGKGSNVPIDMSSPNIAKPISMGHLRSTVIGNALANILKKIGYKPVKINHLGDWGTQFGKLIVAYKLWGSEEEVQNDPITNLLKYYVKFHEEAETKPELDEEARQWFKKLEDGDAEAIKLWGWFREESLKEFNKIYDMLDIQFDSTNGEAFYNDKMDEIVELLTDKNLLKESKNAQIVDLDKYDLNPALIKKSDGATLYITRDLAAALYRYRTYDFDKSIYVVGAEQTNHFNQLKAVLNEMDFDWGQGIKHVPFGLITQDGKKLSTRKGNIVLLEKVLNEAVDLAKKQISEKNPDLANKDVVANDVGIGAVVFHDLKNERTDSFDFNLEEVVSFIGQTGPYVQYTNARANSILRKAKFEPKNNDDLNNRRAFDNEKAWNVVKDLYEYPNAVLKAAEELEPSVIAKYALNLSKDFNKYYADVKILEDDADLNARLNLVYSVTVVLQNALALLGVKAPKEM